MIQENKELLLKDLCARLPYGVMMGNKTLKETSYRLSGQDIDDAEFDDEFDDLPYLRPMSSMTEEERIELKDTTCPKGTGYFDERYLIYPMNHFGELIGYDFMSDILDWLNSHHFDYRGLIEKGLALEAPEDMYKTE